MDLIYLAEAYPLASAGGAFLAAVGTAIALGAARMKQRYVVLGIGASIATAATVFYATSNPIPRPSGLQIASLAAAIVFEIAAIAVAGRALVKRTERSQTLAILAIVGAHFFIMGPAFGPFIIAVGGLSLANAALGTALPRYTLAAIWLADGAIKLAAGAAMLLVRAFA